MITPEEQEQLEEFYAQGDPFEEFENPSVADMLEPSECNLESGG